MIPRIRLVVGILLLFTSAIHSQTRTSPPDPADDGQMLTLLTEARTLMESKKAELAIEKCETIITYFHAFYEHRDEVVYCARTSAENLAYMLKAAAEIDAGKFNPAKKKAITLSSIWSDAYFLKAFALQDLRRISEAKSSLTLALELSPWNSHYSSELGNIYQLEKTGQRQREAFEKAEEHAELSPDKTKAKEMARARRGLAYVFVELGQLDEAETKISNALQQIRTTQEQRASSSMSVGCEPRGSRNDIQHLEPSTTSLNAEIVVTRAPPLQGDDGRRRGAGKGEGGRGQQLS